MDSGERIRSLVDAIGLVAGSHPEAADAAAFAFRTIAASSPRAQLREKRLSAAASMSVASSAMAFVSSFLGKAAAPPEVARHLANIAEGAALLAPSAMVEHEPAELHPAPDGWSGPAAGPFTRTAAGGILLVMARRPFLPGGEWSVYYGGVPAAFGRSPDEAAAHAAEFCALVASGCSQKPPGTLGRALLTAGKPAQ